MRVLGLQLHLWNKEVMKKIANDSGGWLENEEERTQKPYEVGKIRVRGPRKTILSKIEIAEAVFLEGNGCMH